MREKIFVKWRAEQFERGWLGFPKRGESECREPDNRDRYQIFEGGRIYWRAATGETFAFKNPTTIGDNGKCDPSAVSAAPAPPQALYPGDSSIIRRTQPQALKIWLSTTERDDAFSVLACPNNLRAVAKEGGYLVVTEWKNLANPAHPAYFNYDTRADLLACRQAPMIEQGEGTKAVRFGPRLENGDRTTIPSMLTLNMDGLFPDNTPYTVFAVVQRANGIANNYFFSTNTGHVDPVNDERLLFGWKWDRTMTLDQWADFVDLAVAPKSPGNNIRSVVVAAGDGRSLFVSVDEKGQSNSAVKNQGVSPLRRPLQAWIGAALSGSAWAGGYAYFEGNIYEIIVYNERLKQSEIDSIKNYLIGRYIRP